MKITEQEVEKRAKQFWAEIKGIIALLNKANSRFKITDHRDITVSQYLMWRILNETKTADIRFSHNLELLQHLTGK